MIVWRITGNEIGPNDCGAAHFATKREAEFAIKEYMKYSGDECVGPEKLVVNNRRQLAILLNDAMGFGGT